MIEEAFNAWADENGVAKVPNAVVAFLEIKGCLDEDAVNEKFPFGIKLKPPFTVMELGCSESPVEV
jgi:hypothetical protein